MKVHHKGPFTTKDQELFLQAALMKGEDAINAWKEWSNTVDLEGYHDSATFRIMPLLYLNLQRHGIKDPFMNKLKGIYRKAWYKNQRLYHDMSKILQYIHDAGVQTMLLNGSALTAIDFKNHGVLPVSDMDVLVPTSQAMPTIDLMLRANWIPINALKEGDLFYRNSMQLKDSSGKHLVLHWRFCSGCGTIDEKDFWDGAISIALGNVSTLAPDPANILFHIIVNGADRSLEPSIQWIADATILANAANGQIDWMRLINQAKKRQVCLRLRDGLNFLHDRFQLCIPKMITDNIKSLHISRLEHVEYHFIMKTQQPEYNTPCARLFMYLCRYLRLTNGSGIFPSIIGFPKYLLWELNAKNYYYLFSNHISKGISETAKRLLARLTFRSSDRFIDASKD